MILLALNIHAQQRSVIAIVLEKDNLARMREGDPVTLESIAGGGTLPAPHYPANTSILISYLEDSAEFYEIARKSGNNPFALMGYLEEKRQWRPEVDGKEHTVNLKDLGKHSA
jgi:hypothetical protein